MITMPGDRRGGRKGAGRCCCGKDGKNGGGLQQGCGAGEGERSGPEVGVNGHSDRWGQGIREKEKSGLVDPVVIP